MSVSERRMEHSLTQQPHTPTLTNPPTELALSLSVFSTARKDGDSALLGVIPVSSQTKNLLFYVLTPSPPFSQTHFKCGRMWPLVSKRKRRGVCHIHWDNLHQFSIPCSQTPRLHSKQVASRSGQVHACVCRHLRLWHTHASQKSHIAPYNINMTHQCACTTTIQCKK